MWYGVSCFGTFSSICEVEHDVSNCHHVLRKPIGQSQAKLQFMGDTTFLIQCLLREARGPDGSLRGFVSNVVAKEGDDGENGDGYECPTRKFASEQDRRATRCATSIATGKSRWQQPTTKAKLATRTVEATLPFLAPMRSNTFLWAFQYLKTDDEIVGRHRHTTQSDGSHPMHSAQVRQGHPCLAKGALGGNGVDFAACRRFQVTPVSWRRNYSHLSALVALVHSERLRTSSRCCASQFTAWKRPGWSLMLICWRSL